MLEPLGAMPATPATPLPPLSYNTPLLVFASSVLPCFVAELFVLCAGAVALGSL